MERNTTHDDEDNDFLNDTGIEMPIQDFSDEKMIFIEDTDFTFDDLADES